MEATYEVSGMTCGGCVAGVTKAVERATEGVQIDVSLEAGQVVVRGDHERAAVIDAIEGAGFDVTPAAPA